MNYSKEEMKVVVKEVKQTIKDLVKQHKGNLKYRPYAQDISYAMKAKGMHKLSTADVMQVLMENDIKIKQPVDKEHDPKSQKIVLSSDKK